MAFAVVVAVVMAVGATACGTAETDEPSTAAPTTAATATSAPTTTAAANTTSSTTTAATATSAPTTTASPTTTTTAPRDPYASWSGLSVVMSDSGTLGVRLGGITNFGCLLSSNISLNNVSFTNVSTKWQWRDGTGGAWTDIPGTETTGICGHAPTAAGDYRMAIDSSSGKSSSSIATVE